MSHAQAVRDAVRAGRWEVLDDIAVSSLPYPRKAELGLVAARTAAIAMARDESRREEIARRFCVDGSRVLVSSFGLPAVAAREPGALAVAAAGRVTRVEPAWRDDVVATVRGLAERHAWRLPDDRARRLRAKEALPGFHGLGRFEFDALLHSSHGRAIATSAPELADVVYPVWRPRALGLTLTYRCTASCGHCYNASGPRRSAACLGWSETGEHLTEWARLGVDDIGLSGGEPFLYPDLVVDMVRELRRLGVRLISPFTNGFWGADEHAARALLLRLRDTGFGRSKLDQIKISAGEFHAPHVPVADVLTVAALHHEIIGNPVVMDVAFVRTDQQLRELVAAAKARGVADRVQWMARADVTRSGRARAWHDTLPHEDRELADLRCPVTASASLYPGGDWVYCSGTSWPTDYRRVGSLTADSPHAVLARTQRDARVPYWQFGSFADWARDHPRAGFDTATIRMPARATPCGACRDLFGPARGSRPDLLAGAR